MLPSARRSCWLFCDVARLENNPPTPLATPAISSLDSVIIAPFFADVDTLVGNVVTYGSDVIDGVNGFGVNGIDVGYFSQNVDKSNRFQLRMIYRSDIEPGAFAV